MTDTFAAAEPMEHRIRALAARGFSIDVGARIDNFGQHKGHVVFTVRLNKGSPFDHSQMSAQGYGVTLDEAATAALRAGEAFLASPEPSDAVAGALSDLSSRLIGSSDKAQQAA